MASWQLQEAKAKLSELIRRAAEEGPQTVTYRGSEKAVVLSVEDYRHLVAARPSLTDYLLTGPTLDDQTVTFINDRSRDMGREIEL